MYDYSLAPSSKQTAGMGGDYSRPKRMNVPSAGHRKIGMKDDLIYSPPTSRTASGTRIASHSIRSFMLCLGVVLTLATKAASAHPTVPNSLASHTLKLSPILYTPPAHNLDTIIKLDPEFPEILLDYEPSHGHLSQQNIAKRQDGEAPPISTGKATALTSSPETTMTAPTRTATTVNVNAKSSSTGMTTGSRLPEETNFPLPTPFEAMGNNFTAQSCPDFMQNIKKNEEFKACLPFSAFLEVSHDSGLLRLNSNTDRDQTSTSFFQMMKSPYQTTVFLDRSCAANTTVCDDYMTKLAGILILPENCKLDYDEQDPIVHQAYNALLAYKPLYQASCLRNEAGTGYCFTDMAGNSSAWMDPAVYSLGIGKPLVESGANETSTSKAGQADGGELALSCSSCLKNVMSVLNSAANSGQENAPVRKVWKAGAEAVNSVCGAGWANETVADVTFIGNGERTNAAAVLPLVVAVVAAVVLF